MALELTNAELSEVKAEALRLSTVDNDEIFEIMGRDMHIGASDQKPSYYINMAKSWFAENEARLRSFVCESQSVKESRGENVATMIGACVTALCDFLDQPLQIAAVSAAIVKGGLEFWCAPHWNSDET